MSWPRVLFDRVPSLTADQMREVDRAMVEELGISLVQMMENAGRSLAEVALGLFRPGSVSVLAGTGGNGGGGLAAARHLANRGVSTVVTLSQGRLEGVPGNQLAILEAMGVAIEDDPRPSDLVIDALIGYSLRGDPKGRTGELIEWTKGSPAPVLSLDAPSGLDVTTGRAGIPAVDADATVTLALPKVGLRTAPQVGRLFLADISVPPRVYERLGLQAAGLFDSAPIIELLR